MLCVKRLLYNLIHLISLHLLLSHIMDIFDYVVINTFYLNLLSQTINTLYVYIILISKPTT